MKALILAALLGASGDVNYVKTSGAVVMSSAQTSQLVTFIGAFAPSLTAANAIRLTCQVQGSIVTCEAQAKATASPSAFLTDYVAGKVVSFTSVVP